MSIGEDQVIVPIIVALALFGLWLVGVTVVAFLEE